MNTYYFLKNLKIEQLQIIIGHLKLGKDHLKKQLTRKQFKELVNYGVMTKPETREFTFNRTERLCHLSMLFNCVMTGIFGIWMGLAQTFRIDVHSKLLHIAAFALICCGLLSISVLIAKKKDCEQNKLHKKFQKLQSLIFEIIRRKQNEKLHRLIISLKRKYEKICNKEPEKEPPPFEKKEDFFSWFYLFHQAIHLKLNQLPKDEIFQYYRGEVQRILKKTEDSFTEKGELIGNFGIALNKNKTPVLNEQNSALNVLIDPSLSIPQLKINQTKWYKQEIFKLTFDLFPTIVGALGSILMWCNSPTILASLFNLKNTENLLDSNSTFYFKIAISIFFTLNSLFFYYYPQKRHFQRLGSIELKKKGLLNQEAQVMQMTQTLNLVFFLNTRLEEMMKFLEQSALVHKFFLQGFTNPTSIISAINEGKEVEV